MALDNKSKSILEGLTSALSDLASGRQPQALPSSDSPVINKLIDTFNLTAKTISSFASVKEVTKKSSDQILLEEIIDSTPDWIFIKDREHRYIRVNSGYAKALHLKPSDFIGKTDLDLGFPEELVKGNPQKGITGFWPLDDQVMNSGKTIILENDPATIDGKVHIFHTVKTPIRNEKNEIYAVLGFARDITDLSVLQKKLDQERVKTIRNAKLASLGEMSAGIAHEINNPLAIIAGTVGLLKNSVQDPQKLGEKIATIRKSCERISRIVGGLKKFSRSGDKYNYKNHNVSQLIQDALVLIEPKSKLASVTVTFESKSNSHVLCDEVEIEQVIINLINNSIDAIKESPEKWVKVLLYDDHPSVVVRIMDSGHGIPEKVRDKIFEPFFTTKEVGEGTGLGLSISKGILDEHKAIIGVVADSPNTCFELRFSRAEGKESVA